MIRVAYAVCSDSLGKPLTRAICDSRQEAEVMMARLRRDDIDSTKTTYWLAELGPEAIGVREHYEMQR